MNIDAVHQKIADDEALPKAEAFGEAVSDALFAYTCATESVEDCYRALDPQGNEEAAVLLREVYETAAQSLNAIDDALRDYNAAFRKLAGSRVPSNPETSTEWPPLTRSTRSAAALPSKTSSSASMAGWPSPERRRGQGRWRALALK